MIEQYSDSIVDFEYNDDTENSELTVRLEFKENINLDAVRSGIQTMIENWKPTVETWFKIDDRKPTVTVSLDEIWLNNLFQMCAIYLTNFLLTLGKYLELGVFS